MAMEENRRLTMVDISRSTMVEVCRSEDSEAEVLVVERSIDRGSLRDLETEREQGNREKLRVGLIRLMNWSLEIVN